MLPRRWALLPFVGSALYMTLGQVLEIGPLHFPVIRILILVGFARAIAKREFIPGGLNLLDRAVLIWAAILILFSIFHASDTWILRLGIVWTEVGSYFLFRFLIRDLEDIQTLFAGIAC